jgi:diguanylate cyclase (GGDEF)-like protein/PAS domain S-box-containing protein
VLAALALSAAPASAELAGPPVAPHLPFQVGDLAVLAIALILVLAAAVWTLFVTGFWIRRSRREHERERQRELQLDLALNNISQGLCMFDAHAKIVVCNRAFINMYGLSPEIVRPGCSLRELLTHRQEVGLLAEDPEHYAREIVDNVAKGRPTTRLLETLAGRFIHAIDHPIPGGGWVTTHEDITERRVAELAIEAARTEAERAKADLQLAHQRLRDAFEAVPEGLVLFDADDRLVMWNSRYAEMYPVHPNLTAGARFEDYLHQAIADGAFPASRGREAEFVAERLAQHRQAHSRFEQQLPNDRWVRAEERRTADGGIIGMRVDVTELKNREASFRLLFERNPVPMWVLDQENRRFLAVNDAAVQHYGYSREQFLAMSSRDIRPPEDRDASRPGVVTGPDNLRVVRPRRHVKADGTMIDVEVFAMPLTYEGRPALLGAVFDVTERLRAEAKVRETQQFLDMIVENIPVSIIVKTVDDGRYALVNRATERLLGVARESLLGKSHFDVLPKPAADAVAANDQEALATGQSYYDEIVLETPANGTRLINSTRIVLSAAGQPKYIIVVIEDVTDRKAAEARIAHLTRHDQLTDLPHGAAAREHLEGVLERVRADREALAVLQLDLDRFKEVNDVFGPSVGDAALREIAERFRSAAPGAYLARSGDDEFTLVAEGAQPSTAEALAERVRTAISGDIAVAGHTMQVGASIGVAIFPSDGADAATLVANADAALQRAKADGRGAVRFFDGATDKRLRELRALQHDLRSSVTRELAIEYQPLLSIGRAPVGFEGLLRWHHPTRGLISPTTFIPLAEDSGLIVTIGEWVLREACREAASWSNPLQIAVNLSPVQFRQGDLTALVRDTLAETGLAPARLELEITEGALIHDQDRALASLKALKALGVKIALDDFGTGYASLSYLQSFPFDKLKIDRSFVSKLHEPHSASIVRGIIALAHGMGLRVVGEGVETDEQMAFLAWAACDEVQGFLLGEPATIGRYLHLTNCPATRDSLPPDAA